MRQRVHRISRAFVLLALLGAVAPAALAEKLVFNPSIGIGPGYTNNLAFQGSGDDRQSDILATLQFEIPLERDTRRSKLRFQYRPTILRYQDFEELDYVDQRAELDWSLKSGRRGQFRLRTSYVNTQQQGSPEQPTDPDLNLTTRADREIYRLYLRYGHQLSKRWDGEVLYRGQAFRYLPIAVPGLQDSFQNRSDNGIRIGGSRKISSTVSVGGRYEYRYFDLKDSNDYDPQTDDGAPGGSESTNQLAVTYTQRIARRLDLEAALGGYANSGLLEGTDRSGVLAELFLTRTYKKFSLRLDLFHRPSAGGSVNGTSVQTTVGLTFRSDRDIRRNWIWQVSPRATRRDSSQDLPTVDTLGLRGDVERRFGNLFGLRLRTDWYDQSVDQPGRENDTVFRANLMFLWYPWGGTDLGGRGG